MFPSFRKDKKEKGEKGEKERRKRGESQAAAPAMSQQDLQRLEEAGLKRGFFNLTRSSRRGENSSSTSSSSSSISSQQQPPQNNRDSKGFEDSNEGSGSHVLQRASVFGVLAPKRASWTRKEEAAAAQPSIGKARPSLRRPDSVDAARADAAPPPAAGASGAGDAAQGAVTRTDVPPMATKPVPARKEGPTPAPRAGDGAARPSAPAEVSFPVPVCREKELALPVPDVRITPALLPPRDITLHRRPAGDFGFSLRRAYLMAANGERSTVHYAEPGARDPPVSTTAHPAAPASTANSAPEGGAWQALLPGDRLLAIDEVSVEGRSREDLVAVIRAAGTLITLRVQPAPELCEIARCCLDIPDSASARRADEAAQTGFCRLSAVCARVTSWLAGGEPASGGGDRVWVVHQQGFTLARMLGPAGEGRVRVRLDHDGCTVEVDEDDLEKASPENWDHAQDVSGLHFLNESSVLHTLRQRHGNGLLHTRAGEQLVCVHPGSLTHTYSDKVMHLFRSLGSEDPPPHLFAVVRSAYRTMLASRRDQSIVCMGPVGSGKTTALQHAALCTIVLASGHSSITAERLQAAFTLLESFGHAAVSGSPNSSRHCNILSLDFDATGALASASIQAMLLERSRVTRWPAGEETFNVFHQLLAGADSALRSELSLHTLSEDHAFGINPPHKDERTRLSLQLSRLVTAMKLLGFSAEEQNGVWRVLATIYHLGASHTLSEAAFSSSESAHRAAAALGCAVDQLTEAVFDHSGVRLPPQDCVAGLASALYGELFNIVVNIINRSLRCAPQNTVSSLMLVDAPGWQTPSTPSGSSPGPAGPAGAPPGHANHAAEAARPAPRAATFQELCVNYLQERLLELFRERTVDSQVRTYRQEGVEVSMEDLDLSAPAVIAAIDQPASQTQARGGGGGGGRAEEAKGLLWLLDEEAMMNTSSDEAAMMERFFTNFGSEKRGGCARRVPGHPLLVSLAHADGAHLVTYDTRGWISQSRAASQCGQRAGSLLAHTSRKSVGVLLGGRTGGAVLSGSVAGLGGASQPALRRATSVRKAFSTGPGAARKKSAPIQVKLQVEALVETLRRARSHFILCLSPSASVDATATQDVVVPCDIPHLRTQLRASRLMDALRLHRQGFPERVDCAELRRRFSVLAPHPSVPDEGVVTDEKKAVKDLLEQLELDRSSYQLGHTQVFMRAGVLRRLEREREHRVGHNITLLQAACRGYLARVKHKKRKVQAVAIRCIQRNVRKQGAVRDWLWWRLYTYVLPLVHVNITEETLRARDDEIQQLKSRLEKVEKERNELRVVTERLEGKVSELSADVLDERGASESANQLLETETTDRLRMERENRDLRAQLETVRRQLESVSSLQSRLLESDVTGGDEGGDDDDDAGAAWNARLARVKRDAELERRRLQQEAEEQLQAETQLRRQLERKMADVQADGEDMERALQQAKRRAARLTAELQDTKLQVDALAARNAELEKKQRRFDTELAQAQEEARSERQTRERVLRDKDTVATDAHGLRTQLQDSELQVASLQQKVESLEAELETVSSQESKDEASVARLRKTVRELEGKTKEQEEELDEQAGTIQILEQAKLRSEMALETLRQSHHKELESRDEEVEETRLACQKKLRQMEMQLDEEAEEKQKILKERRELEAKLAAVGEQASSRDVEAERTLRLELRRTRALLNDAQTLCAHLSEKNSSRKEVATLKSQLEEAELACAAAVKSRKALERELEEAVTSLDEEKRARQQAEEQLSLLQREVNELQNRAEEAEEDSTETLRKHKAFIAQATQDALRLEEVRAEVDEVKRERQELQSKVSGLEGALLELQQSSVERTVVGRLEARVRELTATLDLERCATRRVESQLARSRETVEKLTSEKESGPNAELRRGDTARAAQRQLRELREEAAVTEDKHADALRKLAHAEAELERVEAANQSAQTELKLAFRRITELQAALEAELGSDDGESDGYGMDSDEDGAENWMPPRRTHNTLAAGSSDDDDDDAA
ncbi:unconventional myosin-XVIIIa-like isoform X2 [Lampetra fluviatilis]